MLCLIAIRWGIRAFFLSDIPEHDPDDDEFDDDDDDYDYDDDDDDDDDDYDDDDDVEGMLEKVPGIALEYSPFLRGINRVMQGTTSTANPDDFDDEYEPANDAPWNVIRKVTLYPELSPERLEEENDYNHFLVKTFLPVEEMTDFTKEHVYALQHMINDVNAYMERQDTQTRAYIANMKYGLVAA